MNFPLITYKTQSYDTTIAAEIAQFAIWRSWNLLQKATNLNDNTYSARCTAWHITKITLATQNKTEQIRYFLKKVLDSHRLNCIKIQGDIKMTGVIEEALIVAEILESLDIPYLVGGSVASGFWGEMRYTQDIDIVADFQESQITQLIKAFSPRFDISEIAIREAIKLSNSFNLIDNETGWKIDIFMLTQDSFAQSRFKRKQNICVAEMGRTLNFSTPEDTILQKLLWYRMTQKQSTQQWRDILGILKLQQSSIDLAYLQQYAHILQLSEEIEQALRECGFKN